MSGPLRIGRLRRRSEYLRVAASGRKVAAPGLVLQVRAGGPEIVHIDGPADAWLGITVSKRVGGSVQRNRARRRLRSAARELMPRLAQPGHDYVLIGRQETLTRPYPALLSDLEGALRRSAPRPVASAPAPDHLGTAP